MHCSADLSHQRRAAQHLRDAVGVAVGRRSAVLQVAIAIFAHLPRNPDAGAAVGDSGRELVQTRRLVPSRQSALIVFPLFRVVGLDVFQVLQSQLLDGLVDVSANKGEILSS